MEQRRLRLGDILDDYCPRERRVTNHAVVAMIEEDIKQTRCTTCDAEHAYKGARVPRRRKKETPAALYKEVLASLPEDVAVPAPPDDSAAPSPASAAVLPTETVSVNSSVEDVHPPMYSDDDDQPDRISDVKPRLVTEQPPRLERAAPAPRESDDAPQPQLDGDENPAVDGPVHRPLIRATLPRPEGQKDARPLPEFTVRHAPTRGHGGSFRNERIRMRAGSGNGSGQRDVNGNRVPASGSRFQGGQRSPGGGRQQTGRGGTAGFRNAGGSNKRGRGSRG
jgi:hypothetical protein